MTGFETPSVYRHKRFYDKISCLKTWWWCRVRFVCVALLSWNAIVIRMASSQGMASETLLQRGIQEQLRDEIMQQFQTITGSLGKPPTPPGNPLSSVLPSPSVGSAASRPTSNAQSSSPYSATVVAEETLRDPEADAEDVNAWWVSPELSCPDGFQLNHKEVCEKKESKDAHLGCPDGWNLNDKNQCEGFHVVAPELVCPDGFSPFKTSCVLEQQAPKRASCPLGYLLSEDTRCIRHMKTPATASCPLPGSKLSANKLYCTSNQILPPLTSCPSGYTRRPSPAAALRISGMTELSCVKEVQKPPQLTCPPNFVLKGTLCYGVKASPLVFACRPGFTLQEDRSCQYEESSLPEIQCPLGSERVGKLCISKKSVTNRVYQCAVGWEPSLTEAEVCVQYDRVPAKWGCPDGFIAEGAHCERIRSSRGTSVMLPQPQCPAGYTRTSKNNEVLCVKPVKYEKGKSACPETAQQDLASPGFCFVKTTARGTPFCRKGRLSADQQRCVITTLELSISSCPSGYSLMDQQCIRDAIESPEISCPPGFTISEQSDLCIQVQTFDLVRKCSHGYTLDNSLDNKNKGMCVGTSFSSPKYACPANYRLLPSSVLFQSEEKMSRRLFSVHPESRHITSFFRGLQLFQKNATRLEIPCLSTTSEILNTKQQFPDVQLSSLTCVNFDTNLRGQEPMCDGREERPAILTCPSGFTDTNGKCLRTINQPYLEICPVGYAKDHHQECTKQKYQMPVVMCPIAYVFEGPSENALQAVQQTRGRNLCVHTVHTVPKLKCPNSAVYDAATKQCHMLHNSKHHRPPPSKQGNKERKHSEQATEHASAILPPAPSLNALRPPIMMLPSLGRNPFEALVNPLKTPGTSPINAAGRLATLPTDYAMTSALYPRGYAGMPWVVPPYSLRGYNPADPYGTTAAALARTPLQLQQPYAFPLNGAVYPAALVPSVAAGQEPSSNTQMLPFFGNNAGIPVGNTTQMSPSF